MQNVLSQIPVFFKGKKINVGPAVKRMVKVHLFSVRVYVSFCSVLFSFCFETRTVCNKALLAKSRKLTLKRVQVNRHPVNSLPENCPLDNSSDNI